tara:strand:- start:290 stop:523 length:234 start_codon:yes stop_codon:yes gene_type:complete
MKGVKYNLKFRKSKNEFIIKKELTMSEICDNIKTLMNEHHLVENIKCNNQTIYNLYKRPKNVNRLLKNFIEVERINS